MKQTNAHKCKNVYYVITQYSHVFRPLLWPSSGRCLTKHGCVWRYI